MIPADFNEDDYLAANPDVAEAVRLGYFASGREHYERFGHAEQRALSPGRWLPRAGRSFWGLVAGLGRGQHPWKRTQVLSRAEKALSGLNRQGRGLEIGPSYNPIAPKRAGYQVQVLDHLSAEELRQKYASQVMTNGVNLDNIEEVDFVWRGEPLAELVGERACFDWIIASHVIEHMPDPIGFFQQCELLLKPGGRLSLIVPDKRYCFDYFNAPTSTGDWLDAHAERRTHPSPGQVFTHLANSCRKGGLVAWWAAAKGDFELIHTFGQAREHVEALMNGTARDYIDVHCWRFTPASFAIMLADVRALGLTRLEPVLGFPTEGCEFYVTLGLSDAPASEAETPDRLAALRKVLAESRQAR
ncbi:MAG: methyltransferase domain-containing protein [Chromatiaceae bacterium]|nr:methyltransferase domain-containing protein [Chromatiaceae bacterium]